MKKYNLLFSLLIVFFTITVFAQSDYIEQIESNIELAEKYIAEGNQIQAADLYNKIAFLYRKNKKYNEAAKYYNLVLKINKELNNSRGLMKCYDNLGILYLENEDYENALPYLKKTLEYNKNYGNKEDIVSTQSNIGLSLYSLGQYNEALKILEEATTTAREINHLVLLKRCYQLTYENYDKLGQSEKAYQYFELFSAIDKKIKRQEMDEVKTEAETKVNIAHAEQQLTEQELNIKDTELKKTKDTLQIVEKISEEQKMQIELQEAQIEVQKLRTKMLTRSIFVAGAFLFIFSLFIIFIYRTNRKIKHQKNILERQNKEITSSINYAQTIQQAMLPDLSDIKELFDTTIIYWPKDIVSGDFYWVSKLTNKNNEFSKLFIAVVDCTGHGVPGAFMSMIGNQLLNELVNKRQIEDPKEILNLLNIETIKALRQDQTDNKDGMDLSVCCFERSGKSDVKVTFAGAKRNLLIIRNNTSAIEVLRGDRHSIGGHRDIKQKIEFTNKQTNLNSGDHIYMFTDGIIDQNSTDSKRFGTRQFEDLLIRNRGYSLQEQKELIENELSEFMKDVIQRDDITVMLIKML